MKSATLNTHADYVDAVHQAINRIGETKSTSPPHSNVVLDSIAQEYALASAARAYIEKRYERAKSNLLAHCPDVPPEAGQYMPHDSAFVVVTVLVKEGASRLDENATISFIADRCDTDLNEAIAMVKQHCYAKAKPAKQITAVLKK